MEYVGRENLLDKSEDSVYKLVILASQRALEIAEGQPKLVEANSSVKPSTISLREIASGKVVCAKAKTKE
jgi:DNA-directed RNA polymerase omega subunit